MPPPVGCPLTVEGHPPDTERAIPGSRPTLSCARLGSYDLLFPVWSLRS